MKKKGLGIILLVLIFMAFLGLNQGCSPALSDQQRDGTEQKYPNTLVFNSYRGFKKHVEKYYYHPYEESTIERSKYLLEKYDKEYFKDHVLYIHTFRSSSTPEYIVSNMEADGDVLRVTVAYTPGSGTYDHMPRACFFEVDRKTARKIKSFDVIFELIEIEEITLSNFNKFGEISDDVTSTITDKSVIEHIEKELSRRSITETYWPYEKPIIEFNYDLNLTLNYNHVNSPKGYHILLGESEGIAIDLNSPTYFYKLSSDTVEILKALIYH